MITENPGTKLFVNQPVIGFTICYLPANHQPSPLHSHYNHHKYSIYPAFINGRYTEDTWKIYGSYTKNGRKKAYGWQGGNLNQGEECKSGELT